MSNIERLIENVLVAMSENPSDAYQAFEKAMSQKHNRQMLATVYIKQQELWAIAQYVFCTWVQNLEAEPVKHSRWRKDHDGDEYCENCARYMPSREVTGDPSATDYCPNCGAKMDGGDAG